MSMMKNEFYIPKDEVIPTRMRLKVDDKIDVYYERIPDAFGYIFSVWGVKKEEALEIVKEITRQMENQSYDHGASWRETKTEVISEDEWNVKIEVYFRVRDAG